MKIFAEYLKEDLLKIEKEIKKEKDEKILIQLKKDKKNILDYISSKSKNNDISIEENKDEIAELIITNQVYCYNLYGFSNFKNNDKEILNLFNEFIKEDEFDLKYVYEKVLLDKSFKYDYSNKFYSGCNFYIPSLNKNYILITKDKKLYECNSIIHELGHAKVNMEGTTIPYINNKNSFLESYSVFLEFVFADYLKSKGKLKEGYQLKYLIFNKIKDNLKGLYNNLNNYLDNRGNQRCFIYGYNSLKGDLLGLYFYYLYLDNKSNFNNIINNFITDVKNADDKNLIKKLNINQDYFSNKNIYKLYNQLKMEKNKIK